MIARGLQCFILLRLRGVSNLRREPIPARVSDARSCVVGLATILLAPAV